MSPESLSWRAPEHRHIERGSDWYWALGIVAISAALTALLFANVLFALLIVVAAITFGLVAMRPAALHEVSLAEDGLIIGDEFYPYGEMRAFWIQEDEPPLLLIDTPRFFSPDLVVPLVDTDVATVHAFLSERVPEKFLSESPLYMIVETLGL